MTRRPAAGTADAACGGQMARYVYRGDALTDPALRGQPCDAVRRPDGRCVVGGSKQLTRFADGREVVVMRRQLRVVGTGSERRTG